MSACQHNTWRDADEVNASGHAVIVRYCRERGCAHVISETLKSPLVGGPVMPLVGGSMGHGPQNPSAIGELYERVAKLEGTVSSLATAMANLLEGPGK